MSETLPLTDSGWDQEEIDAMVRVIESGQFTYGPEVKSYEKEFASYFGSSHAVAVNSGSSANLLALEAIALDFPMEKRHDLEVVVPAIGWGTTYFPIHQAGFALRIVDVDSETYNIDIDEFLEAIGPQTAGVMVPNILGNPAELSKIRQICDDENLFFIEDNCESMGASVDGKFAGTFGDIGTFSTYFSHHMNTIEGGSVVTDRQDLFERMMSQRSHGWIRELSPKNSVHDKTGNEFDDAFTFVLPGYNLRPTEFTGALGLIQLSKLQRMIDNRRTNAANLFESFQGGPFSLQKESFRSSWFGFGITINDLSDIDRRAVISRLGERGIATRPLVGGNILRHPVRDRLRIANPNAILPNSDRIHRRGFMIGNHGRDLKNALDLVNDTLSEFS